MESLIQKDKSNAGIQVTSPSKIPLKHLSQIEKGNLPQSYVPFLFKNKKFSLCQNKNPAPGQYELKSDFQQQDLREVLAQKFHVLMQNTKKIKQSVVFKSAAKRFNYKQQIDENPISYSYGVLDQNFKIRNCTGKKAKNSCYKSLTNISERKFYPSIPDNSIKFGYSMGTEGKLKKINKTEDQLIKQKQSMKNYVKSKLNAQKIYSKQNKDNSLNMSKEEKKQIIQKMKEKINCQVLNQKTNYGNESMYRNSNYAKNHIKVNNSKCNQQKIYKILQQKKRQVSNLGPGSYDVRYKTFQKLEKQQKFQFFNSTSQRFMETSNISQKQNSFNEIKKKQLQNKIYNFRKTRSSDIWKRLKKPVRIFQKNQSYTQPLINPGPGAYNPNQNLTKHKIGKISTFDKSLRFSKNDKQKQEEILGKFLILKQKREKARLICKIQQNGKLNINVKLKQDKQQTFQQYKNLKIKQQVKNKTQNSISSWENRPISRIQTFPSVVKQQTKIEK